jgi:hypothetical protein
VTFDSSNFLFFIFLKKINGAITFKIHTRKKLGRGVTKAKKLVKKKKKTQFVAESGKRHIKKRK